MVSRLFQACSATGVVQLAAVPWHTVCALDPTPAQLANSYCRQTFERLKCCNTLAQRCCNTYTQICRRSFLRMQRASAKAQLLRAVFTPFILFQLFVAVPRKRHLEEATSAKEVVFGKESGTYEYELSLMLSVRHNVHVEITMTFSARHVHVLSC